MSNMPIGSAGLLGRRGCHRTAAEISRLLLSLAPESDPCCSLLAFDYYCLRSREPDTLLLPFVGRLVQHPSLLLLPSLWLETASLDLVDPAQLNSAEPGSVQVLVF